MSKVVVIYDSKTGLTEKMAKAVVEGVKEVRGIEVELFKAGTPFSISKIIEADDIILGSPSHYGSETSELKTVLESMKERTKTKKLDFSGKIGGIFTSYAWDGGFISGKLEASMQALGIKVVASTVSVVDRRGGMEIRIDADSLQRCRRLGKDIAMNFAL